jgi:hypothetical protein
MFQGAYHEIHNDKPRERELNDIVSWIDARIDAVYAFLRTVSPHIVQYLCDLILRQVSRRREAVNSSS